jgi:hypothetical protein
MRPPNDDSPRFHAHELACDQMADFVKSNAAIQDGEPPEAAGNVPFHEGENNDHTEKDPNRRVHSEASLSRRVLFKIKNRCFGHE